MSVVTSVVRRPAKLPTILAPSLILILMAVVMTRQVRLPAKLLLIVTWVVSAMYCFNIIAWLVLSCILKPARAIAFLCLLAGPGMYVVLGAAGLFKAQQMIVGSQEKKKAAQKLKELNLRTQDIIAIVISGLVLLVMFAAFILLGFLLFTSSLDSPASIGPALGMLGGGVQQAQKTSSKAQSQVGGAVEKIDTARPSTRARARPRWSERLSETARGRARLGDRRPERAAVRRRRGARAGPSHARRGAGGGRGVRWRRARP
mmetsp:Transcript_6236/g.18737  ORF Transcript_6236/g.18737 Transcript_6236/m.18737 type:complete len:260 (+) Transcript_6236:1426-2205(+)